MPTVYPIAWEPPAVTGRYRNLQRRDFAVWERWLRQFSDTVSAVAYDVAIGGVEPDAPNLTDADRLGFKYSTALKIDVLMRFGEDILAVEIKESATISAVGAAVGYPLVLQREEPELGVAGGGIIAEVIPPDIAWLATQLQLRTWTV